ncbi:unnamed protein product [Thelazia callipaeda]|uniref:Kinase n=1 Tax=Thelazia callipaeda TaxID=103827 RepID=A0A0N5D164_THECL|nr:unnamed protein product [Thelazia callipaeda]
MTDDTITFVVVTDCTDGLLGECVASEAATVIKVNPIGNIQTDVFLSQLAGLNRGGYGLEDAQTQCLIIYFKLVLLLELDYDPEFCNVHNPENIWQMLQSVKLASISSLRNIISHQGIGDFAGEETKGQGIIINWQSSIELFAYNAGSSNDPGKDSNDDELNTFIPLSDNAA